MGIFDYVVCDYPLPIPDEAKDKLSIDDWSKVEFQTHSFIADTDAMLGLEPSSIYSIESDGQLYKDVIDVEYITNDDGSVEIKENKKGIEKLEYTGEIHFFNLFEEELFDYILEFSALFWKGELRELNLKDWSEEDNERRKKAQDVLRKHFDKAISRRKKWYGPFVNFYKNCVRCFCRIFRYLFMFMAQIFWKLEQWLTLSK